MLGILRNPNMVPRFNAHISHVAAGKTLLNLVLKLTFPYCSLNIEQH